MTKKILIILLIAIVAIAAVVFIVNTQKQPKEDITKQQLLQKFQTLKTQYEQAKAKGYDVSEVERLGREAKQAFDKGDYKKASELLDKASAALEKLTTPAIPSAPEVKVETICADGIDNDEDRLIDNRDGDCWIREGIIYRTHPIFYPNHSFKEITKQIPSIKELGVKTILLAPFWETFHVGEAEPASMSYNPLTYYKLDSRYGTERDLKDLMTTAHKYDMKVLLDLVTCSAPPGSDWHEYGTFKIPLVELEAKYPLKHTVEHGFPVVYYNHKEGRMYDIKGIIDEDNNVVIGTAPEAYAIATDRKNLEVIEYFANVVKYYLKEYDVDGFRMDAVAEVWNKLLFPEDHTIFEMLERLKSEAIKIKPSSIFQSEEIYRSSYDPKKTTDQICEISFEGSLIQLFSLFPSEFSNSENFVKYVVKKIINHPFQTDNPYKRSRRWQLENLNTPRVNVQFGLAKLSPDTLKPLIVTMSTLPGTPKIVAGQEIGETQEGGRWGTGNHEFFTANPEVNWTNGNYELRNFYKKVFAIRNSNPALKYGGDESIKNIWKSGDNIYAYSRTYENETAIVVINFQGKTTTSILNLPFKVGDVLKDELSGDTFNVENPSDFKISVPAYGSRILTIKR